MCEGKDKYVWLATCMCEVTVYKFRYSTFTLWLIYVCVCVWCGDTHAVRPCLVVSGRWRGRRASLCHCLSVSLLLDEESGSEMWSSEWNIKQPAAAGLSGHRPVRGWTTGLLCVCLCVCACVCVSVAAHTRWHACMSFCLCLLERSVILFCLFVTCSLWTFLNTVMVFHTHDAIQLCVCTHAQVCMCTICKPHLCVCHNDISLPSSHSICLLTDWG